MSPPPFFHENIPPGRNVSDCFERHKSYLDLESLSLPPKKRNSQEIPKEDFR